MNQKQEQARDEKLKEHIAPPPARVDDKRDDKRVDMDEMERMRREDPLFLEKTRPEDASGRAGQRTRDNVNPAIPSAEPGKGGIVDPTSLGMEQGGIAPKYPPVKGAEGTAEPQEAVSWPAGEGNASLNEPPGSNVSGGAAPGTTPPEAATPVITSLEPDEATIGEETFDLFVIGEGFTEGSVIVFAGYEEPTDLEDDGSLSTGINMDVWQGADVVKVSVKNGDKVSNEMDFTFHAEPAQRKAPPKPKRKGKGVKAKTKSKAKR